MTEKAQGLLHKVFEQSRRASCRRAHAARRDGHTPPASGTRRPSQRADTCIALSLQPEASLQRNHLAQNDPRRAHTRRRNTAAPGPGSRSHTLQVHTCTADRRVKGCRCCWILRLLPTAALAESTQQGQLPGQQPSAPPLSKPGRPPHSQPASKVTYKHAARITLYTPGRHTRVHASQVIDAGCLSSAED